MFLIISRGRKAGWRGGLLVALTLAVGVAGWWMLLLTGALLRQRMIRGP